jgi:hypothetical protein
MEMSGKAALQANSLSVFTASWNESTNTTSRDSHSSPTPQQTSLYYCLSNTGCRQSWVGRLTDDFVGGLEGHVDDVWVEVGGCEVEDGENVLPAGTDFGGLGIHHLRDAADNHVTDPGRSEMGRKTIVGLKSQIKTLRRPQQIFHGLNSYGFFFMMTSKGRRKSFWNRKLENSPFSMNFMESCRRESMAKKATSSEPPIPTPLKCPPSTSHSRDHTNRIRPML